jgi:hypothetical protein
VLLTRQSTPFRFQLFDASHSLVGTLEIPDIAVATNARLDSAFPSGWSRETTLTVDRQTYTIEFEYLSRAWVNDLEYRLKHGEAVLASVIYRHRPRRAFVIETPFRAELLSRGSLFAARVQVVAEGVRLGAIFERGFSVSRRLWIDLPDTIPRPIQFFLSYLVFLRAFS